jgi:plastocyanin
VAHLQVTGREFTLRLSRPAIAAGPAVIQFIDAGQDPHDLHVRPAAGGADVLAFDVVQAGSPPTDRQVTLAAGQYVLYCSLPGHEQAGMRAVVTVN